MSLLNGKTLQFSVVVIGSVIITLQLLILINQWAINQSIAQRTADRFTGTQGALIEKRVEKLEKLVPPQPGPQS